MKWIIAAPLAVALSLAAPAALLAQTTDAGAAAATPDTAAAGACETAKPKKKKGPGLGNVLRSARAAGVFAGIAGYAGSNGHLVNSVTNTAINASAMVETGEAVAKAAAPSC